MATIEQLSDVRTCLLRLIELPIYYVHTTYLIIIYTSHLKGCWRTICLLTYALAHYNIPTKFGFTGFNQKFLESTYLSSKAHYLSLGSDLYVFVRWIWKQFISFESISELWKNQPTYLLVQMLFIMGGAVTLIHALNNGGRRPLLWLCIICHGLVVESMCYIMPEIDNFWHSTAPVMFFRRRLPLYVIILYTVFYYIAIEVAYRTNKEKVGFIVTVGLNVFLIDLPYDIMGIKFVHWTWHDTDPNIKDRMYWVPWTSYYFHMVFSASFVFWFFIKGVNLDQTYTSRTEILTSLKAIFLSTPCGILCFSVLYHPLHDLYNVPTQTITVFLITLYIMLSILKRKPRKMFDRPSTMILYLTMYYATFLCFAIWGKPENEISIGPHEEIGPCNITVSTFGTELKKRKYLCIEDYNEDFDFHCVNDVPAQHSLMYAICGTPFKNRIEYIILIITIIIVAFTHFNESFKIIKKTVKSH